MKALETTTGPTLKCMDTGHWGKAKKMASTNIPRRFLHSLENQSTLAMFHTMTLFRPVCMFICNRQCAYANRCMYLYMSSHTRYTCPVCVPVHLPLHRPLPALGSTRLFPYILIRGQMFILAIEFAATYSMRMHLSMFSCMCIFDIIWWKHTLCTQIDDLDMQLHVHIVLTGTYVDMHAQYARRLICLCPVVTYTH